MDNFGLTSKEKKMHIQQYNHALFENMSYFTDGVLEINVKLKKVTTLLDRLLPEWNQQQFKLDEFKEKMNSIIHKDYFGIVEKVLDIEFIKSLKESYSFENMIKLQGRYHFLQCAITPCFDEKKAVDHAYITVMDVQSLIDIREDSQYRIKSELARVTSVLSAAQMGLWSIIIDDSDGVPDFVIDSTTAKIVGIAEGKTPKENYKFWFKRVEDDYKESVADCVEKIKNGIPSEIIYPYNHPKFGRITIRCGGALDKTWEGRGICLRGYHQDITFFNEQLLHQVEITNAIQMRYHTVMDIDFCSKRGRVLWDPTGVFAATADDAGFMELDFSPYYYMFKQDAVKLFKAYTSLESVRKQLKLQKTITMEVESANSGWYRFAIVPSSVREDGTVDRAIYLTESIDEAKRQEIQQHKLLADALDSAQRERAALTSIATIYDTLHVLDLDNDTIEEFSAIKYVHDYYVRHRKNTIQSILTGIMDIRIRNDYKEILYKFIDLSTLGKRMKNKKHIYMEVESVDNVWYRFGFIRIDESGSDKLHKVIFVSQNIDDTKRELETLFIRSTTDELTGVLNRYAYENTVSKLEEEGLGDDVWFIGIDLNGLKKTNDSKGHMAGDELIIATASCIKDAIGELGSVYRVGGDEFCVILRGDQKEIYHALNLMEQKRKEWKGEYSDSFSFSKGVVSSKEIPNGSMSDLEKEADRRMYVEKRSYYNKHGGDRRKRSGAN